MDKKKLLIPMILTAVLMMAGCQKVENPDSMTADKMSNEVLAISSDDQKSDEFSSADTVTESGLDEAVVTFSPEVFMDCVLSNDQEKIKELIKEDAYEPNYRFEDGKIYFENALAFMNLEMAEILFESGADPDMKTSTGETVAEIIEASDSEAMINLLHQYKN